MQESECREDSSRDEDCYSTPDSPAGAKKSSELGCMVSTSIVSGSGTFVIFSSLDAVFALSFVEFGPGYPLDFS